MTIQSNLYVEKVISEHPVAVWMLNEQVDYVSLISETNRQIYNAGQWSVTGGTSSLESPVAGDIPFPSSVTSKVTGSNNITATITNAVGDGTTITYTAVNSFVAGQTVDITGLTITTGVSLNMSDAIIATASGTQFTVLSQKIGTATSQSGTAKTKIIARSVFALPTALMDPTLSNFAIGGYIYISSTFATSYSYGYQYDDGVSGITYYVEETNAVSAGDLNSWLYFSHTFEQPPVGAVNAKLVIRVNVNSGGGAGSYNFYVNGLSLAQWSEEYNRYSLGVTTSSMPSTISLPSTINVIPAIAYSSADKVSYYCVGTSNMYAKNFGIPLVYGSSNVTKLYPNVISGTTYPSLLFPGYGFLNKSGQYNEYTAEMWLSLNSDAAQPRRIFGPIASTDGLYVEGGFLTFVIGKKFRSHFVGEWYRPMLIHIRFVRDNISVLLNGEEVINISFIESDLSLPSQYDNSNKSQDWLGFYTYSDIHPFSIDSFAIYSYPVPNEVAKRRFVWGQGITPPELENASLNATTAFADYSFSNYAVNYNYPDFANWQQGFFSNVLANRNSLQLPEYSLPNIYLGSKDIQTWYDDLKVYGSSFPTKAFSFRPNSNWNTEKCYLYFPSLSVLNELTESIYGIFETGSTSTNQILFKLVNKQSNDYLLVTVEGSYIYYKVVINGVTTILKQDDLITINSKFLVGINLTKFALQNVAGINKIFENQDNVSVYVGGDGTNTFSGLIYKVGFDAKYNNRKNASMYNANGIAIYTQVNQMLSHTANYTLVPLEKYNTFFADIAIAGYWEDYVPLSYFAKYIKDYDDNLQYDLDTIQFNVDYPEPLETNSLESTSSWTYQDLFNQFNSPDILQYEDLANSFFTTWDDYEDMSQASVKYYYYDTSAANVRTYISFQKISDGVNRNLVDFVNTDVARAKGIVDTDLISADWEDTAFEVVDGTIIYPPSQYKDNSIVDFNDLGIVSHVEFKIDGILHNPIRLRDLELASQVYERTKFTEIGTKYGVPIYPYHKTGIYYDFKGENPVEIYKDSTPHLFLTRHSGWRMRGEFSPTLDRGIAIAVNSENALGIKISSIQLWVKYADREMPNVEMRIFSIVHKNGTYDFYLTGDSSTQRGYIYAKDRDTDAIVNDFEYHINGQLVDTAYLINEEWSCLGIAFPGLIDFDSYPGRITLNGPMTYNNVSYSIATNLEQEQRVSYRSWGGVLTSAIGGWNWWEDSYSWREVKIISENNVYSIDPSDIYARYVGTNRIIVDDDNNGILFDPEKIRVYGDVEWSTSVKTAV
jgi:hypothetical protein